MTLPCCCGCDWYTLAKGLSRLAVDSGTWTMSGGNLQCAAGGGKIHSLDIAPNIAHSLKTYITSTLDSTTVVKYYPSYPDTSIYSQFDASTGLWTTVTGLVTLTGGVTVSNPGFNDIYIVKCGACSPASWAMVVPAANHFLPTTTPASPNLGFAIEVSGNTNPVVFNTLTGSRQNDTCLNAPDSDTWMVCDLYPVVAITGLGNLCVGGDDGTYHLSSFSATPPCTAWSNTFSLPGPGGTTDFLELDVTAKFNSATCTTTYTVFFLATDQMPTSPGFFSTCTTTGTVTKTVPGLPTVCDAISFDAITVPVCCQIPDCTDCSSTATVSISLSFA